MIHAFDRNFKFEQRRLKNKELSIYQENDSFTSFQNGEKQGSIGFWSVDSQLQGKGFSLDLLSHVGFRGEDAVGVIHVVKLEKFFDQHDELFAMGFVMKCLTLDIFPIEGRDLNEKKLYFFLGAWLIDDLEDAGADLSADVGKNVVGFESLNDKVFEFVELLHW
jgi:hypothetical protein